MIRAFAKINKVYILLLAWGMAALSLIFFQHVLPQEDSGAYVSVARGISSGHGFSHDNSENYVKDFRRPPLYPYFLALIIKFISDDYIVFRVASLLFVLLGLCLLVDYLYQTKNSEKDVLWIITLMLTNYSFITYSCSALTEPIYMVLSILTIALAGKHLKFNKSLILSLVILAALMTRPNGIINVIYGLAMLLLCVEKKSKPYIAFVSLVAVLSIILFFRYYVFYLNYGMSEGDFLQGTKGSIELMSFLKRSLYQLLAYAGDVLPNMFLNLSALIKPRTPFWWIKLLMALFIIIMLICSVSEQIKEKNLSLVFLLMSLGLLVVFPAYSVRFLYPVYFLVVIFFYKGLSVLGRRGRNFVLVIVLAANIAGTIYGVTKAKDERTIEYQNVCAYVKKNLSEDAVLISRKMYIAYLLTDRKTSGYPYYELESMYEFLKKQSGKYIIFDNLTIASTNYTEKYLEPVYEKFPEMFEPVYSEGKTMLYKINKV